MQTPMMTSRPPAVGDALGRLVAHDAFLQPQHVGADRDGLPGDLRRLLGAAEHIHDVDRRSSAGTSSRRGYARSPSTSVSFGLTGTIRYPCSWRYRRHLKEAARPSTTARRPRSCARPRAAPGALRSSGLTRRPCRLLPQQLEQPVQHRPRRAPDRGPSSSYAHPRPRAAPLAVELALVLEAASVVIGTVRTAAISPSLTVSAGSGRARPRRTGVTRIPTRSCGSAAGPRARRAVRVRARSPRASRGARSRRARRRPAPASPPGNETSPACRLSSAARSVKSSAGSGVPITTARTAASRSPAPARARIGSRPPQRRAVIDRRHVVHRRRPHRTPRARG